VETIVTSLTKKVIISDKQPTVLIGERINPAGKKKLTESLKQGSLDVVRSEALTQTQAGADILDVCVGTFGADEVTVLPKAVQAVMEITDLPLCIDSANLEALEAALKVYKGKPLVNSVTGEEHSLEIVLPLVKKYGAAVVGLVQDDEGIPKDAKKRVEIAHKIVKRAEAIGISRADIVIDCLTFAVGADTNAGPAILEAIRRIKEELGVNMTLGASNVSFGLPDREALTSAFVVMTIAAGVTSLIVDTAKVRPIVLAADLVLAKDNRARRYIAAFRQRQNPA
jgi:5-methyltetrahydrofolate--homocysteine methyltransferase